MGDRPPGRDHQKIPQPDKQHLKQAESWIDTRLPGKAIVVISDLRDPPDSTAAPGPLRSEVVSSNSRKLWNLRKHGSHSRWRAGHKSSKCVHDGEANCVFQDVRYLIDFISTISDVSSGLAPFHCGPGVDSNS